MYDAYKSSNDANTTSKISTSTTGACLNEALERFKRYEQKLKDSVQPNEETLKKLNSHCSSNIQKYLHQKQETQLNQMKSTFQSFPNGSGISNNQSFEDLAQSDANNEINGKSSNKIDRRKSASGAYLYLGSKLNKQLPEINRLSSAQVCKPTSAKPNNAHKSRRIFLKNFFSKIIIKKCFTLKI